MDTVDYNRLYKKYKQKYVHERMCGGGGGKIEPCSREGDSCTRELKYNTNANNWEQKRALGVRSILPKVLKGDDLTCWTRVMWNPTDDETTNVKQYCQRFNSISPDVLSKHVKEMRSNCASRRNGRRCGNNIIDDGLKKQEMKCKFIEETQTLDPETWEKTNTPQVKGICAMKKYPFTPLWEE